MDRGPLLADLRRADTLLTETARRLYVERPPDAGEFHGLFVTEDEFLALLARPFGASLPAPTLAVPPESLAADRWTHLQQAFGLTRVEADVLLLCLLPEIDLKYERIYGFLQDDVTSKRPTVDLLLQLLSPGLDERLAARSMFETGNPLREYALIAVTPPVEGADSLLRRTVQVAPEIVRALLDPSAGPPTQPAAYWQRPGRALEPALYPGGLAESVGDLLNTEAPLWVHAHAPRPWSTLALALDVAAASGRPVVELTVEPEARPDQDITVRSRVRDALLWNAVLLVRYVESSESALHHSESAPYTGLLGQRALTVIWHGAPHVLLPLPRDAAHVSTLSLPAPDYDGRLALWQRATEGYELASSEDLAVLAARYRLDGEQIGIAARSAAEMAWQRSPADPIITFDDLAAASRGVSAVRLGDLASQIVPRHTWSDLVLPDDRTTQIQEMCDQFRYRHIVYGSWGFGRQSARGQGLSALFAGPSGTGKTMAAEVIANDLSLDLYKIDLSGVVSKYIGETEKNLDRIFELAQDSNAIMLFDEADALFGKRSETKDAHDRYANIEISYLLQKVEEYDGVVILTSNLRQNLDEAFLRRLQFSVEFPFPDESSRRLIWERTAPAALPLADDVDFGVLAARFRLSGGSIRNALVNAAFLAAREDARVGMRHLLWGIRREFQKLGKLVDDDDFASLLPGRSVVELFGTVGGRYMR